MPIFLIIYAHYRHDPQSLKYALSGPLQIMFADPGQD